MKPTVLIVDDDARFLTFLGHKLQRGGYHVLSASDGCEVPDLLSQRHVDVLVLDLQMPGMNGWEVIRHVQEQHTVAPRRSCPKIIVLSGRSEAEAESFVRRLGADAYLTKPLWGEQILSTVRSVLRA